MSSRQLGENLVRLRQGFMINTLHFFSKFLKFAQNITTVYLRFSQKLAQIYSKFLTRKFLRFSYNSCIILFQNSFESLSKQLKFSQICLQNYFPIVFWTFFKLFSKLPKISSKYSFTQFV